MEFDQERTELMLTWWRVRAGGDRLGSPVIPQAAVSIVRKGAFGSDHSGSDPASVVRRGRRQVWDPWLRVRMMMASRLDRVVMPGGGVGRVIAPALGEALMAGGYGWVCSPGGCRRGTTGGGAGSGHPGRVVGLVVGCGASGGSGSSGGWRPEAESAGFPVVPGRARSGGGVRRQIVVGRGVVPPVCLVMVEGVSRGRGGRVVRVLGMMGTVAPAGLGASGGRVGMTNDARWSSGGRC